MRVHSKCLSAAFCLILLPHGIAFGQEQAAGATTVPRLVSFGGVIKDAAGTPVNAAVPVTFSLFAEQEGGTALWSETQVVDADAQGHYSVFLGATNPAGLPLGLFTTGVARWLAVEPGIPGPAGGSRILLVGVPYALKAADADTLGGKPASAFVTAASQTAQASGASNAATPSGVALVSGVTSATVGGTGTTDFVPLWTSSTNLGNSILFESGTIMEVKGALELPALGTATTSTGYDSQPFDLFASAYNSSSKAAVAQHFRWEAEPVSNDTSAASGKVDLLYGAGTATPSETGLSVSSKGVLTFASGQTFPGTGSGTITGVTAGTDLTGGGTTGKVTLNLDTTKVPQLKTANTFTGDQSVTGNIFATGARSAADVYTTGYSQFAGGMEAVSPGSGIQAFETGNADHAYAVSAYAQGNSAENFGVYSGTASPIGAAVYGYKSNASVEGGRYGALGAVWGDTGLSGYSGVFGTSDDSWGGVFFNNSQSYETLYLQNDTASGAGGLLYAAAPNNHASYCAIDGSGNLSCSGTKSAVVPVDHGARRVALYAVEAPENWFEDFGSGRLSGGGATIALEPTFAQTVNTAVEYHVFLTPNGESDNLYVTNKTAFGFEVRESHGGRSNIAFDYRIVARRKGYETIRLPDKTKDIDAMRRPRRNARGVTKAITPKVPESPKLPAVAAVHQ